MFTVLRTLKHIELFICRYKLAVISEMQSGGPQGCRSFTGKGIVYCSLGGGWHGLSFIADKYWRVKV